MTSQRTSGPKNHRGKRRSPGNHKTQWLWFWAGVTGIAIVSATAGALLAVSFNSTPLQQARLTPEEEAVFGSDRISGVGFQFSELSRPVNLLVMGMSVLPSDLHNPPTESQNLGYFPQVNSFDGLADVMILIQFDPDKKKIAMLSIPRDTRTEVIGYGEKKLNAANVDGGPALTAQSVSNLLENVVIDRYVRINVLGVAKLIDALGGVTVTVPTDLRYQDDSQRLYINLKAGKQHLNGDQALQLLRFRHDELGDIGRVQRQQTVIQSLIDQSLNPVTIKQLPKILTVVKDNIDTNLTVEEILTLLGFGIKTERSQIHMLMLPGRFSQKEEYNTSYWLPNKTGISRIMSRHFGLPSMEELTLDNNGEPLQIYIQDTTGASRSDIIPLVRNLETMGYSAVHISTSRNQQLPVTKIIAQQGDTGNAQLIRDVLGFGEVRVESTGVIYSDITIQLGQDWWENRTLMENNY